MSTDTVCNFTKYFVIHKDQQCLPIKSRKNHLCIMPKTNKFFECYSPLVPDTKTPDYYFRTPSVYNTTKIS